LRNITKLAAIKNKKMKDHFLTIIITITTTIVTLGLKWFFDNRTVKDKLEIEFKNSQKIKIKKNISTHKAMIIKIAESLNNRIENFSINHNKNWLRADNDFKETAYYLDSFVYRILSFFANIELLDRKLNYLDTTISDKDDLTIIKFIRLFYDIVSDGDLFEGVKYDFTNQVDHIFKDNLKNAINTIIKSGEVMSYDEFKKAKENNIEPFKIVYRFLEGMNLPENRLRVERIKVLQLALIAFLNKFGYDFQATKMSKIKEIENNFQGFKLIKGFKLLIEKYKLTDTSEIIEILNSIEKKEYGS